MKNSRQIPGVLFIAGLALTVASFSASAMPFCGKSGYGKNYPHPYYMAHPYGHGFHGPMHPAYGYHGYGSHHQHPHQNHGAGGDKTHQGKKSAY